MFQRICSFFARKLDKDGDGKVTIGEVEGIVEETSEKIRKTVAPVRSLLERYRLAAEFGVGYIACFYGGNFSHLFLCASAFQSAEGQSVLNNLSELGDIARDTSQRFADQVGSDGAIIVASSSGSGSLDDSPVEIPSSTFIAILASIEPGRVLKCVRSMYAGFLVALCAAHNENAAKLGLGLTLGDRIANLLISVVDRFVEKAENKIVKQKEYAATLAWGRLAIRGAASSSGVFLTWKLKDMAATWSTCHWGGCTIATSLFQLIAHEDVALQEMLGFGLGGMGFMYHLKSFNSPEIPSLLKPVLMPVTLLESILRGITLRNA